MSVPQREPFAPYPLLWLAAALAAGILLGRFSPGVILRWLIAAAPLVLLAGWFAIRRQNIGASILIILATVPTGAALETATTNAVKPNQIKRLIDDGKITSGDPVELGDT